MTSTAERVWPGPAGAAADRPPRAPAASPEPAAPRHTGRADGTGRPRRGRPGSPARPGRSTRPCWRGSSAARVVLVDDRQRRPADRRGGAGDAADEPGGAERAAGSPAPAPRARSAARPPAPSRRPRCRAPGRRPTQRRARPATVPGTRPATAQDSPRQSASRHSRASVANGKPTAHSSGTTGISCGATSTTTGAATRLSPMPTMPCSVAPTKAPSRDDGEHPGVEAEDHPRSERSTYCMIPPCR